jgi:predicted flap endonuclease-1-like 5' DNA nuclease
MSMDFRSRSADVRREAADILWRFRSSRAARRAGTGSDAPANPAAPPGRPGLPVSPATAELIRSALSGPLVPVAAEAVDPNETLPPVASDSSPEAGKDIAAPIMSAVQGGDCAREDPAPAWPPPFDDEIAARDADAPGDLREAAQDSPGAPDDGSGQQPRTAADTPGASAAADADGTAGAGAVVAQDLTDLPGVGAGLVWLLGRCGVHTLADLAAADATRLEQELGLVGQLLDLPSWIDLARQAIATEGTSTP